MEQERGVKMEARREYNVDLATSADAPMEGSYSIKTFDDCRMPFYDTLILSDQSFIHLGERKRRIF